MRETDDRPDASARGLRRSPESCTRSFSHACACGPVSEWRLLFPVLTVAESFNSALLSESKMLRFQQPAELTGGTLNGKVEARAGSDEIYGLVGEDADAPLLRSLA